MSSNDFWENDPQLFWAYHFSYIEKLKEELERDNQYMWLQGAYIFNAVSVAITNAFSKQKLEYIDKPIDIQMSQQEAANTFSELTPSEQFNMWASLKKGD